MKDYTLEQIIQWKEKAEKWDALDIEIGQFYPDDEDETEDEDEDDFALGNIGEIAAMAFGYL